MRSLSVRPFFIGACALLLGLSFGANAALAAPAENVTCQSGSGVKTSGGIRGASQGGTATVNFTVASGCNVQLSLVSYQAPAATFSASTASQQVVFDSATATFASGAHTLSVSVPNCFFQVDFVFGQPIAHLGPAGSNNFYSAQGRLISAANGGTRSCSEGTPTGGGTGGTATPPPVIVVTPSVTPTVTTTVVPAGAISWAAGFGPNGVVASVQAAPLFIANLPSTSTAAGDADWLVIVGIAVTAIGLVLLRRTMYS